MVIALAYLVNTVSSYFGVDIPILASIAGMSLIPLIFMYISSYVFKFCEYHRMFLHYIAVNDIINIYDWYIGISVTNRELFVLHMSITGISLFIILYLYVKSHKKLTIKNTDRTRARYNLALSFCIYNKYLICACKVIYLLYCMGVKFYITLHCIIIS